MRRFIWVILCAPFLLAACQSGGGGGWAEQACRERLPNAGAAEIRACVEREYRIERARARQGGGP